MSDSNDSSGEQAESPPGFDPLLAQAEALPNFIKGSEGDNPNGHVLDVGEDGDEVIEETIDESFGYEPVDPSSFTAD